MKTKLALLFALFAWPLLSFGQGLLSFNNLSGPGRVYDVGLVGGTLLNNTNYRVGLYFNLDTNSVSSGSFSGTLLGVTSMSSILAGRFNGGNLAVPGAAPTTYVAAQVRVWYGNFPSYEAMIAAGNYDAFGNCISGECEPRGFSAPFLVGPLGGAPVSLNNMPSFALNVAPIPEPSPLALAGLAALAWFGMRRMRRSPRATPR